MALIVILIWVALCAIAVILSVLSLQEPYFYVTNSFISKRLLYWIVSMVLLDVGVILIVVIPGYIPMFYLLHYLL